MLPPAMTQLAVEPPDKVSVRPESVIGEVVTRSDSVLGLKRSMFPLITTLEIVEPVLVTVTV